MKKCMLALVLLVSCAAKADMTVDIQAILGEQELKKTVTFNNEIATHVVEENGIRCTITAQESTEEAALFAVEITNTATQEILARPEIKATFNQEVMVTFDTPESTDELTVALVATKK